MNKSKDKAKKSKQRKILIISAMLAVLIIVGGTFAWFTSKDEVTNRLTASNTYGVSILESFSAPENWTPGQVVTKQVQIVNTGNVDAFVRASISSTLDLTVKGTSITALSVMRADSKATALANCVELTADEVKSLQAGGTLVRTPSAAQLLTTRKEKEQGTNYTPKSEGPYIFERNDSTSDVDKYVGYYYSKETKKYYKLDTIKVTEDAGNKQITSSNITLVTTTSVAAKETATDTTKLTYNYDNINATTGNKYITVTYNPNSGTEGDDGSKAVIIRINLADDWATNWEFDQTNNTFYYKKTVKAGGKTELLIKSLELDSSVTKDAYIDFQYDLTINSDSVQVVTDENKKQQADSVPSDWYTPALTYESGEGADTNKIASIVWTKKTQASETSNNSEEASTEAESN